jgi:peptidoglycan hydrolase-like protein with peptidoglycan-binding domain
MQKKKGIFKKLIISGAVSCLLFTSITVSAASPVLKTGSRGEAVVKLQNDLKTLGFFNASSTGYYGSITTSAVKKLQKSYGIKQDGISGSQTYALIDKLLGRTQSNPQTTAVKKDTAKESIVTLASRGNQERYGYKIPWFDNVENFFSRGKKATVLDIETGLSFNIMRSYGTNHADCETLTAKDTEIMKSIYNGQWSWARRAVIVTVDGVKIAASMAGMPHAGDDDKAADTYVSWRSGGYGYGVNLDKVKKNNMDGHFDIHFLGSKTHGTNKVDSNHQNAVKKAADWANANLK